MNTTNADYLGTHTGVQIDDAVDKVNAMPSVIEVQTAVNNATKVEKVSNPALSSAILDGIKIGNTTYRVKRIVQGQGVPSSSVSSGYTQGDLYIDITNSCIYYLVTSSGISLDWRLVSSSVSGSNDGTNWTNLTINGVTKSIPSGGVPAQYIKSATVTNNVLRLTDQSGTSGTDVNLSMANVTLAGTEAELTSMQIGATKYKVPTGGGGLSVLTGEDDPTTLTPGILGQLYINTTTKNVFTCTDATTGATIWKKSTNVSGTNDGTNWTSLIIDGVNKTIPSGTGSLYQHNVRLSTENIGTWISINIVKRSSVAFTKTTLRNYISNNDKWLTCSGYIAEAGSGHVFNTVYYDNGFVLRGSTSYTISYSDATVSDDVVAI